MTTEDSDHRKKTAAGEGQLRRLKSDSAAAAEELRQFVAGVRGKSPREVLGAVTESKLTRGIR